MFVFVEIKNVRNGEREMEVQSKTKDTWRMDRPKVVELISGRAFATSGSACRRPSGSFFWVWVQRSAETLTWRKEYQFV